MRRPATAESAIESFRNYLTTETTTKSRTIVDYCNTLGVVVRFFRANGRSCMPWEITQEDVNWLITSMMERNLKVSTRRSYVTPLRLWCLYYGNDKPAKMKITWPKDKRILRDWLSDHQARRLLSLDMTPNEELLVHCELCLGMRRIEVLRLTVKSFYDGFVEIIGKGSQDGKPRTMPFHRDTARVVNRYMEYRRSLVSLAKSVRPKTTVVPDDLLIYLRGNTIKTYSEKGSGLDEWIKKLGSRIGYDELSNHTLRRTFGREMWKSLVAKGRDFASIIVGKMMGIEDEKTLIGYLGIDLDDMSKAMEDFNL